MLIHPWDSAAPGEWQRWLGTTAPFGHLAVTNLDADDAPILIPTHAVIEGSELLVHLARPNSVWAHLEAHPRVVFSVVGDYAYIRNDWRAKAEGPSEDGVPTSYYAAVQFTCDATILDEPEAKAELLRTQLRHLQPDGGHAEVAVDETPYGPMLSGIRGIRLQVLEVVAKFKYDDHKPVELRARVADHLDARGQALDAGAAAQQRRRLAERGEWKASQ